MVKFFLAAIFLSLLFVPASSRRVVSNAAAQRACPDWCAMGADMPDEVMCGIKECRPCLSCPESADEQIKAPSAPEVTVPRPIVPKAIIRECGADSNPDAPVGKSIIYSDPGDGMVKTCASDGSNSQDFVGSVTPCPEVQKAMPSLVRSVARWSSQPTGIAADKEANLLFFTDWLGGYDFYDEENQAAFKEAIGGLRKLFGSGEEVATPSSGTSTSTQKEEGKEGTIYSSSLDLTKSASEREKHMIAFGLELPWGIATDTVNKKIYWTEQKGKKVRRSNYDGKGQEDVVTGLVEPRGIAVDAAAGKIYFADGLEESKIKRADLDGSNVEDIIWRTAHAQPEGVALDPTNKKLYWTERATRRILRANLDGTNPEELLRFNTDHTPAGLFLDVEAKKLYWADEETHTLLKADLDGCNQVSVLTVDGWSARPWGLLLV